MEKLGLGVGRESRRKKGRALEHWGAEVVYFVEGRKRYGCFWIWRCVQGRELDVAVRKERARYAGEAVRPEAVRPEAAREGGRRKLVVRGKKPFSG